MIPHRARFLRGRRSLLEAHRREPHAPVADAARDVDADASRGDAPGGARPIEHTPTADDDVERHLMENARGAFNIVHRDHPGEQSWRRKSTLFKVNICGAAIFVQMASSFIAASENVASVARNRL